ncbi:MAG TPA: diguanylate cyclase [Thermoleophilaceae bacterium]|jgi:diguanylate cyclase (GGDEF)-like protein/PAS domain S-box-containing protein
MRRLEHPLAGLERTGEVALSVLEALPESGVIVFDSELRCVLVAGQATQALLWSRPARDGVSLWDVMPASARDDLTPAFEAALAGRPTAMEFAPGEGCGVYALDVRPIANDAGAIVAGVAVARNLTERKRAEAALARAEARFRSAFDHAPIGMGISAPDGRWLQVNAALCEIVGHSEAELLACRWHDITYPDDLAAGLDRVERLLSGEVESYEAEKRFFTTNGHIVWARVFQSVTRDATGRPLHLISHVFDISDRKRIEGELQARADSDALTGLMNRGRFDEELGRQIARCKRYGERAALLLLDVDRLKQVNDRFGHRAGDQIIKLVARAARDRARETDAVARIGGDEFAVLLPSVDLPTAHRIAGEIAERVAAAAEVPDFAGVPVAVSVGVAPLDASAPSAEEALARADADMYARKREHAAGGGRRFAPPVYEV